MKALRLFGVRGEIAIEETSESNGGKDHSHLQRVCFCDVAIDRQYNRIESLPRYRFETPT